MATKPPQAPPEVDPAYAGLTLEDLRDLRRELSDEESRVSYWRRVIQARIDLLTRGAAQGDIVERLTSVLAESGGVHRRLANLSVRHGEDVAALPDLRALWTRVVDNHDEQAVADFLAELRAAEAELSTFRREIHQRLDEATLQLIARYRADPSLALGALPDIGVGQPTTVRRPRGS
ncbi:MAG: hypothetical protein WCF36_16870 [Candidatus Nanopelagicales bacterium]